MLSKVIRRLLNFQHNKKRLFQKETAVKFVKKPNLLFCGDKPHFCFSADMCGRKTQHQTKTAEHAVFKARGWYWRERSAVRKLYDFRRTAFPPKECRFIDTQTADKGKSAVIFFCKITHKSSAKSIEIWYNKSIEKPHKKRDFKLAS